VIGASTADGEPSEPATTTCELVAPAASSAVGTRHTYVPPAVPARNGCEDVGGVLAALRGHPRVDTVSAPRWRVCRLVLPKAYPATLG